MDLALAAVSLVLAGLLALTAVRKLRGRPEVVATYTRVGVPARRLPLLVGVLLAGAAGLLFGLAVPPVGVAAAAGVVGYFVLAVAAHLRARDTAALPVPLLYLGLSVAALILMLAA